MRPLRFVAVALVMLMASACFSTANAPAVRRAVPVTLTLKIPVAAAREKTAEFIASTTKSIDVVITTSSGAAVDSATFNVTSSSNGCSTTASVTTCNETLSVAPGSFIANITTYDGLNGTGAELAEAQSVPFTATEGAANSIPVTLYGVPATIIVTANSSTTAGTQSGGYTVYTGAPQGFTVTTSDSDGNAIIGAGAPTWSVSASGGSGFTLTPPTASGNSFSINATTNDGDETFSVDAAFVDGSVCSQSGAVCSSSITVAHKQIVFYVNASSELEELPPPYNATPTALGTAGDPYWYVTDDQGNLFAGTISNISLRKPPYSSVSATVSRGSYEFGVDASDDVFVGGKKYVPPYSTGTSTVFSDGDQYAVCGSTIASGESSIIVADAPYATALATLSGGSATHGGIAFDASCDLAIARTASNVVAIYVPPYSSPIDIPATSAGGVAFDHKGDLFASISSGICEYQPPFSTSTTSSVCISNKSSLVMQFDLADDLFFFDAGNIYEYTPPYTSGVKIASGTTSSPAFALTP